YADSPQIFAADDIKGLAIRVPECEVGKADSFGSRNPSQPFAIERHDPDAARRRRVDVALAVHPYSIRPAESFFSRQIDQYTWILFDRVIRLNLIGKNLLFRRRVRHIEGLLVRRKGYSVGRSASRVHVQKLNFAIFREVETVKGQLPQGTSVASLQTSPRT